MNTFDEFKTFVYTKIKEIETEYKEVYQTYKPTESEQKLITFLDDVWGIRFQDESRNDSLKNAYIQLAFIDKDNSNHYLDKNFRIAKLHPKQKKTTPLYYLIARLADSKVYNFYLCPNIFIHSKGHYQNWEQYISASNCYYIDIDTVNTSKPIYNCTEQEILQYLHQEYPLLAESRPSYILMSGGGLHLYFSLEHTEYLFGTRYVNKQRYRHRQLTSDYIKLLNADKACKNMNRLLRVPFSYNMKYSIKTRFFCYEDACQRYSYDLLQANAAKYLLPDDHPVVNQPKALREASSAKENSNHKTYERKNITTTAEYRSQIAINARKALFTARRNDLEKWFFMHLKNMDGYRHKFFLIYSIVLRNLNSKEDYILRQCIDLNNKLPNPFSESELERTVTQKVKYNFKNETIAEFLDFTQYEITDFECHYGKEAIEQYHRECSKKNREKAKAERRKKQAEKESRIFSIIKSNPDATVRELAKLISCSPATACRWVQKYKGSQ